MHTHTHNNNKINFHFDDWICSAIYGELQNFLFNKANTKFLLTYNFTPIDTGKRALSPPYSPQHTCSNENVHVKQIDPAHTHTHTHTNNIHRNLTRQFNYRIHIVLNIDKLGSLFFPSLSSPFLLKPIFFQSKRKFKI